MLAQILGGFVATLCVYAQYKPAFDAIEAELITAGKGAAVFSTSGVSGSARCRLDPEVSLTLCLSQPAGILALFPGPSQAADLRWVFLVSHFNYDTSVPRHEETDSKKRMT